MRLHSSVVVLVVVLGAYALAVLNAINTRAPLGHDESVYALRARYISEGWGGTSGDYWVGYRAPGLPVILNLVSRVVGVHVPVSRVVVLCFGCVTIWATWHLARQLANGTVAVIAAAFLASSSGFVLTSSQLLADVPGTAFGMVAVVLFHREMVVGRLRHSMWGVPLCVGLATFSRFGAPLMLGPALGAAFLMHTRQIIRTRNVRVLVQAVLLGISSAGISAAMLFTDLVTFDNSTPYAENSRLADLKGLTAGTGFEDLREVMNPWSSVLPIWSKPVAVIAGLGVVLSIVGVFRKRLSASDVGFALAVAASTTAAVAASVGLVTYSYLFMALPFWAIVIAMGWSWPLHTIWLRFQSLRHVRIVGVTSAAIVLLLLVGSAAQATADRHDWLDRTFWELRASSVTAGIELGPECVLVAGNTPQVGYYSNCATVNYERADYSEPLEDNIGSAVRDTIRKRGWKDPKVALLVIENGKRQPTLEQLGESLILDPERLFEHGDFGDGRHHTWVQMVDGCLLVDAC
jgi:4-amino-4-deoxy-L-arabinose transferase-like glycosyltransferase